MILKRLAINKKSILKAVTISLLILPLSCYWREFELEKNLELRLIEEYIEKKKDNTEKIIKKREKELEDNSDEERVRKESEELENFNKKPIIDNEKFNKEENIELIKVLIVQTYFSAKKIQELLENEELDPLKELTRKFDFSSLVKIEEILESPYYIEKFKRELGYEQLEGLYSFFMANFTLLDDTLEKYCNNTFERITFLIETYQGKLKTKNDYIFDTFNFFKETFNTLEKVYYKFPYMDGSLSNALNL